MYRTSEIPLTALLPANAESSAGRGISSFSGESGAFAGLGRELRIPLTALLPAVAESSAGRGISSFSGESRAFAGLGQL